MDNLDPRLDSPEIKKSLISYITKNPTARVSDIVLAVLNVRHDRDLDIATLKQIRELGYVRKYKPSCRVWEKR
jgi:hypothetical protein